jgi:hypothetical protein
MDRQPTSTSSAAAAPSKTGGSHAGPIVKRRRWYQFSLRTLLVAMVVVGTVLGLLGIRLQRARRQQEAVVALGRLEGKLEYVQAETTPIVLRDFAEPWVGRDFFDSVVAAEVDLTLADTTQGQLAAWNAIGDLPQLKNLQVEYPLRYPRSRFNIGPIHRLSKLRYLKIRDAQIAGDDLLPLSEMPWLESLDLSHCQVADDAWRHLAGLPRLDTLHASYSFVSDEGAAQLARCSHLRHLILTRANITDRGAAEFAAMANLETLILDGTKISDAGCASLAKMENLQTLSICETSVSDTGLASLAASGSLKNLKAERTNASDAGLRQFDSSRYAKR